MYFPLVIFEMKESFWLCDEYEFLRSIKAQIWKLEKLEICLQLIVPLVIKCGYQIISIAKGQLIDEVQDIWKTNVMTFIRVNEWIIFRWVFYNVFAPIFLNCYWLQISFSYEWMSYLKLQTLFLHWLIPWILGRNNHYFDR